MLLGREAVHPPDRPATPAIRDSPKNGSFAAAHYVKTPRVGDFKIFSTLQSHRRASPTFGAKQRPDQLDQLSRRRDNPRYQNDAFPGWIALGVSGDTWRSAVMIDYEEQRLELRRLSEEVARVLAPYPLPAPNPTLEFGSEDDRCSLDAYALAQGATKILHRMGTADRPHHP